MSCNDYCYNLRFLAKQNAFIDALNKAYAKNVPQPSSIYWYGNRSYLREGIDGWATTEASPTLDGVSTGIGVNPFPPYSAGMGKKFVPIYTAELNGTTIEAPKGTRYLVNYKDLNFEVNRRLIHMSTSVLAPIEYIKGASVKTYKWLLSGYGY